MSSIDLSNNNIETKSKLDNIIIDYFSNNYNINYENLNIITKYIYNKNKDKHYKLKIIERINKYNSISYLLIYIFFEYNDKIYFKKCIYTDFLNSNNKNFNINLMSNPKLITDCFYNNFFKIFDNNNNDNKILLTLYINNYKINIFLYNYI